MNYDYDVETAIFASVIRNSEQFESLRDILKPEQFGWECFRDAWKEVGKIHDSGLVIDGVILGDALEKSGKLKDFTLPGSKVFGRAAISKIRDSRTTPEATESYAHLIVDEHAKRELEALYTKAVMQCRNGRMAVDIVSDVEHESGKLVLHGRIDNHTYDMQTAVKNAKIATELAATGARALETGLKDLDTLINVQKGELITIAAPTGQGKSSLLTTIALNSARQGKRWQMFALEGGAVRFTQRLLSQISGIDAWRIMSGRINENELDAWKSAMEELNNLPIFVTDIPNIKIGQIRIEARRHDVDALAVDYVQLASSDKKNERRDLDIGEVTRGLSALAAEKDIPIFQAAQIDRGVEKRADRKPELYDLRESGSIENDSATVIMMYRPNKDDQTLVDLLVKKHRNGKAGECSVRFNPTTMMFTEVNVVTFTPNNRYGKDE